MRFAGLVGEKQLDILFYTSSTLSFIRESIARNLWCDIEDINHILIKVANGQKLVSTLRTKGFSWKIQGHNFNIH